MRALLSSKLTSRKHSGPESQKPAFSGWWMLLVACLAVFFSGPGQSYGISVFVEPMIRDLDMPRSLFSGLFSVGTLVSAGVLVLAGRQIDRIGNRIVMAGAVFIFGLSLMLLSFASSVLMLLIGFTLLRTFGSSVLTLSAKILVPNWFHTRVGMAFSLLGIAAMLSQAIIPAFNNAIIELSGWRGAFRINGLIVWLILLPIVVIVVRNWPRDLGQFPDGIPPSDTQLTSADEVRGFTLRTSMRTFSFWSLIGASVVSALVNTGLAFHQVAILTDRGFPSSLAATTFALQAALALPVSLLAGWLVDRFPIRITMILSQVFLVAAIFALLTATTPMLVFGFAALSGVSRGLWMVAGDTAWPAYFGRKHLGSIRGVSQGIGVAGAAIGPIPFGLSYDILGSYNPAITAMLILPAAAGVALIRARPPKTT